MTTDGRLWTGGIITGLVVVFLAFDGITKVLRVTPVMEASKNLGLPTESIVPIGILLLVCTALHAIPRTAILGAILLTGYLGGATAIQVRAGSGAFPIAFSVGFGVLVWAGLALREPRLVWWILLRSS
ncbi:MAG TPA: DoxX family protein [Dongiaceae bacterium]|nr:DoxX family protein [Dongiaceae bacterium]